MSLTPSEIEHQLLQAHALAAKAGQLPAFGGLTKRELFAVMAMQGLISSASSELAMSMFAEQSTNNSLSVSEYIAKLSVEASNALVEALETPTGEKT